MELITKTLLLLSVVGFSVGLESPIDYDAVDTEIGVTADNENYRLPTNVVPIRYDLTITPKFVAVSFIFTLNRRCIAETKFHSRIRCLRHSMDL
jgi:hypothetical protein